MIHASMFSEICSVLLLRGLRPRRRMPCRGHPLFHIAHAPNSVGYENPGGTRVFHFITTEAKKAMNDIVEKAPKSKQHKSSPTQYVQDTRLEHENSFFAQVRFFSAVTDTEDLITHIH